MADTSTQMRKTYNIFGIKISTFSKKESKASGVIQDLLDLSALEQAEKLIIFLTPAKEKINGGVMSIFSLCEYSRKLNPDSYCFISTFPGKLTYVINDKFLNNEKILRFEQIVKNAINAKEIILHIPEYFASDFYKSLKKDEIKFLKSKNLQINILNQNIVLMPEREKLKDLYKLTNNVTQTIAHDRYATQETADKWNMPAHLFSCFLNFTDDDYTAYEKENIILYSPDSSSQKEEVVSILKTNLPEYKIIKIENLTFENFKKLTAKALLTISFGEGFDGYFLQPALINSIGVAVYNERFFPNKDWLKLDNVYTSWDDLKNNITTLCKKLENNPVYYKNLSLANKEKHDELYGKEKFIDNLKRFYKKQYDFYPQEEKQ